MIRKKPIGFPIPSGPARRKSAPATLCRLRDNPTLVIDMAAARVNGAIHFIAEPPCTRPSWDSNERWHRQNAASKGQR
jgi:hypothetical protein